MGEVALSICGERSMQMTEGKFGMSVERDLQQRRRRECWTRDGFGSGAMPLYDTA